MKKIIAIIFLFVAVTVSAQDIPAEDTTAKPAITEIGKPDGAKAEMKIGKDGGSFTSSDGKVKLIIPEGAISKKTTFSIQPVTNLMPNGNGKAYRLEPSAIQFQKPVQLVLHYDPEESEDSAQLLMGIAMQDDKGQWYGLNKFTLDTVAKTISGNISHFSIWASFDKLKLIAPKRMKVRSSSELKISGVSRTPELKPYISSAEKNIDDLSLLSSWKSPQKVIWRVNGVVKGNAESGTLRKGKEEEAYGGWNWYYAPANVPDQNPVTISIELVGASFKIGGRTVKDPVKSTKVLIYDNAYEVKMTTYFDAHSIGGGLITYYDSGSFVVNLDGKKTKIIEKLNKNTIDKLDLIGGSCTYSVLKPGTGWVHMMGVPAITVTPATPTQPARVKIQFRPTPLIFPLLRFSCIDDDGKGVTIYTNAEPNAMFAKMIFAFPHCIEFTAKEEGKWEIYEKEFNVPEGQPSPTGNPNKYTIRKLKDKDE